MGVTQLKLSPQSTSSACASQEQPATSAVGVAPLTKAIVGASFGFAALLATFLEPDVWLQPTCVGILWAGIFFSGYVVGSIGRGSGLAALITIGYSATANAAFTRITDIAATDCLLFVALLLAAGWVVARVEFQAQHAQFTQGPWRISIWDLAFATALVACLCHSLGNLSTSPLLLVGVLLALAGGVVLSFLASRWAWRDHWTFGQCLMLFLFGLVGLFVVCRAIQGNCTTLECLQWLLAGPINVIAAQGTAMLIVLAVLRFEVDTLYVSPTTSNPLSV